MKCFFAKAKLCMYTVFCHAVLKSAMYYAQGGLTIILFAKTLQFELDCLNLFFSNNNKDNKNSLLFHRRIKELILIKTPLAKTEAVLKS